MANIWLLTAVTVERAWVVYCITKAKAHRVTITKMMVVVVSIWIAALTTSIAPLLGWNRYIYEVVIKRLDLKCSTHLYCLGLPVLQQSRLPHYYTASYFLHMDAYAHWVGGA